MVSGWPVTHSAVHSLRARSSETGQQREKSYQRVKRYSRTPHIRVSWDQVEVGTQKVG